MAQSLTRNLRSPLILFTYYNPILNLGIAEFLEKIALVGIKGLVVPGIFFEELDFLTAQSDQAKPPPQDSIAASFEKARQAQLRISLEFEKKTEPPPEESPEVEEKEEKEEKEENEEEKETVEQKEDKEPKTDDDKEWQDGEEKTNALKIRPGDIEQEGRKEIETKEQTFFEFIQKADQKEDAKESIEK